MSAKSAGKDSFGQEVFVGNYVYFRIKSKYVADALSLGRVTDVSDKGRVSLVAINTHGKDISEYIKHREEHYERLVKQYKDAGEDMPDWAKAYQEITFKQRLDSVSSAVLIPSHVLPPLLTQILE